MQSVPLEPKLNSAYWQYDFAKHGGKVGDIVILPKALPKGCLAMHGMIFCNTQVTSGGAATIALRLVGSGDVLAATAISGFTANTAIGTKLDFTAGNSINIVQPIELTMTVAVADLTAGKFVVAVQWMYNQ